MTDAAIAELGVLSVLTGSTCGDACWRALEDVCRCSCGGANHACLRTENGDQPTRTCRIKSRRFELNAVASYKDIMRSDRRFFWHGDYILERVGMVIRKANKSEIARWPELAAWRGIERYAHWNEEPYLAWLLVGTEYTPEPREG